MTTPRVALVVPRMASGETGGAETMYRHLHVALRSVGVDAELIEVTCDESDFDSIRHAYARCYELNLDEFDQVISTKAPTFLVRHRNHVSLLVHTIRAFYDRFEAEFPQAGDELIHQRDLIRQMDLDAFSDGLVKRRFAIGEPVVERLVAADSRWKALPFEVLTLPPPIVPPATSGDRRHFLLPGRLHRWKRVDLAIRAVRSLDGDIPLRIVGTGEDAEHFRRVAEGDPRIVFHGRISDEQLQELYSTSIAVPFVPIQEDFGFITVEAFAHGVPVVTCHDSGRPASLVSETGAGKVVDPTPQGVANALRALIDDPDSARKMGAIGRQVAGALSWPKLAETLLHAGQVEISPTPAGTAEPAREPLTLTVLDNQPIDPPVGGGRLRLLGLYRTLDADMRAIYVGSFDWRGPGRRIVVHPPHLEERTVPHSSEHFDLADELQRLCGGDTVIDVTQPILAPLSEEFLGEAREALRQGDVAVFSHPWLFPPLADDVRRLGRPLVYDSHNMEWKLRRGLLGGTPLGRALAAGVRFWEGELCRRADLVLACSEDDRTAFVDEYGVDADRVATIPNGVDTSMIRPPRGEERANARRVLRIAEEDFVAVFIGSAYGPNVDAARWIADTLAPDRPGHRFLIVGGVGAVLPRRLPKNVHKLGEVDDETRLHAFHAADVAINPIPFGSGTNIKMFDFMAAGLATVSTPAGARGITLQQPASFLVRELDEFAPTLEQLGSDSAERSALGRRARDFVCEHFDWTEISARLATLVRTVKAQRGTTSPSSASRKPRVTVVVPSYGRPTSLQTLVDHLGQQTWTDFEVVVVEQGGEPTRLDPGSLRLRHVHTPVKGAVRARNTGLKLARGEIVAFTDDDCLPRPDWLAHIVHAFDDPGTVGVEGLVVPDEPTASHTASRVVTNQGFAGFGFMTANLAARREQARLLAGFDEIFDHPHFREDTDFGWRLSTLGRVPYVEDACVVHPVAPRTDPRESAAERVAFFEKDPLLFEKHPRRYPQLFLAEGHYAKTDGFWEAFRRGVEKYAVRLDVARITEHPLVRQEAIPSWFRELADG